MPHEDAKDKKKPLIGRLSSGREEKRIYYLITEGKTEMNYFNNITNILQKEDANVIISYITKTYAEQQRTDPEDIFSIILKNLYISETRILNIEEISEYLDDWLRHSHIIPDYHLKKNFHEVIITKLGHRGYEKSREISMQELQENNTEYKKLFLDVVTEALRDEIDELNYEKFVDYLKSSIPSIDISRDKLCMIIDRDRRRGDNTEDEERSLEYVQDRCNDHKINLYISNPCFEFWILLHFDKAIANLDREKMLADETVKCSVLKGHGRGEEKDLVRYSLSEVVKYYEPYSKCSCNFSGFSKDFLIRNGINNAKKFSRDPSELIRDLGSNLGDLVEELFTYIPKKETMN